MKSKRAANLERNRANVANWRAKKECEGYTRLDLYLPATVIKEMAGRGIETPVQLVDWLKIKFRPAAR